MQNPRFIADLLKRSGALAPERIDEALAAKEAGEPRVILFNYSGHGLLDLAAYDDYLHGRLDASAQS